MKKIIFLLAFLFATITYAQTPARHYGGVILGSFASDPTGVMEGQIYWNTTNNNFRAYDGTTWSDFVSGSNVNLQDVTDVGNTITNNIEIESSIGIGKTFKVYRDTNTNEFAKMDYDELEINSSPNNNKITADKMNLTATGFYTNYELDGISAKAFGSNYGLALDFNNNTATSSYTQTFQQATGTLALTDVDNQFSVSQQFDDNIVVRDYSTFTPEISFVTPMNIGKIFYNGTSTDIFRIYPVQSNKYFSFNSGQLVYNNQSNIQTKLDFSLINTSDKTFTFPNTSGTIALTSDVSNVSDFMKQGNAGTGEIYWFGAYPGNTVNANNNGTYIFIDDSTNEDIILQADGGVSISSTTASATLRNNLLTLSRDFEFPNASGTLALTSDIGNFVDLTTAQTIGGNKTFTNPTTISNANYTTGFSNTFSFLDNNTTLNTSISANETYNQNNIEVTYNNINSSGDVVSSQITNNYNANSSSNGNNVKGQQINTNVNTTSSLFRVYGLNNEVEIQSGAGNLTDAWGFRSDLFVRKNATKLTSIDALLTTGSSTTFNEVYGIRVDPAISSSTTINNTFHLLDLEDTFINSSATLPTDSYSIYSDVSLPSYFKGNIEIGNASNILLDDNGAGSGGSKIQWNATNYIEYDDQAEATLYIKGGNGIILAGGVGTNNNNVFVGGGKVHTGGSNGSATIENDDLKLVRGTGGNPQVTATAGAVTHAISFDANGGSNTTLSTPNGYVGQIAVAHEKTPQIEIGSSGGSTSSTDGKDFYYLKFTGGNGNETFNLPSATTNLYRTLQFITNSTVTANHTWTLDGSGSQTIDGSLTYVINRSYEGIKLWSDGTEWIIIQAKQ